MNGNSCLLTNKNVKTLANEFNLAEDIILQKIKSWNFEKGTDREPSLEEAREYLKEQIAIIKSKGQNLIIADYSYSRVSDNGYEVSSRGDKRFSALYARFNQGTIIDGVDVSGMTIEDVYQNIVKKSGKGKAPAKDSKVNIDRKNAKGSPGWIEDESMDLLPRDLWYKLYGIYAGNFSAMGEPDPEITKEDLEDFSYYIGYLPLWKEWAKQNPTLIQELAEKSKGKVLTDIFAKTKVSQARALADILNSITPTSKEQEPKESKTPLVNKIISGGQTGVDTIGLQVAKSLGIETGGTAPKGFLREKDIDNEDISSYGLVEITDEEQADYTKRTGKKDSFTGRTELNVRNSDGTVYFYTSSDKAGMRATERSAKEWNKPFLVNPTADELREWIKDNNIKTLNVAGNRGSKLSKDNKVSETLKSAFFEKDTTKEDKEIQEKVKKGNTKAAKMTVYSPGSYGISSFLRLKLRDYGVPEEQLLKASVKNWNELSISDKQRYYDLYKQAASQLKRNYAKITYEQEDKNKEGKLKAYKVYQLEKADGLFILGQLVKPGEKSKATYQGAGEYENKSEYTAVAGDAGFDVQMAIIMNNPKKPIHVYNTLDNKWYHWDYTNNKFIEESTPSLTKNPLIGGSQLPYGKDTTTRDKIGETTVDAIMQLLHKTFGYKMNKLQGLSKSDLNEAMQGVLAEAEEYTPEQGEIKDRDNETSRALLAFNPQKRKDRIEMLSRSFSETIDILLDEELDNIDNNISLAREYLDKVKKTKDGKAIRAAYRSLDQWENYQYNLTLDDDSARKAVIQKLGLDYIFNRMQSDIKELIDNEDSDYIREEYQKVSDNFNYLIQEALEKVQDLENFRVIPIKKKGSDKLSGIITNTQEAQEQEEEQFGDDEEGSRVTGNDGWSFKIRFTDPKQTMSAITKRALNSIEMLDENGEVVTDDLGKTRYLDGTEAHAILIGALSDMIDYEDFSKYDKDNNEHTEFPILESLTVRYPWVKGVIEKLKYNPELVSAFFHDFNMSFIKYVIMDDKGLPMAVNMPVSENAGFSVVVRNFENSNALTKLSVYSSGGNINRDNAKTLLDKHLDKVRELYNIEGLDYSIESNDTEVDELTDNLVTILKSLGFEIDKTFLRRNLPNLMVKNDLGSVDFDTLLTNLNTILSFISNPKGTKKRKFTDDDNYTLFFRKELRTIAGILGRVTELDNVQSFTYDNKSRYSYSAPNYNINLVKKIRSDKRRKDFVEKEYSYDSFFYQDGKYRNKWLSDWMEDSNDAFFLRDSLEVSEVIGSNKPGLISSTSVPYADWTPNQVDEVLVSQYFSRRNNDGELQIANYNFPIFSDSPVCMFITGRAYISTPESSFKDKMTPLFTEVVKQEMTRIKRVLDREKKRSEELSEIKSKEKEEGLKEGDVILDDLSKIKSYDGKRGKEFCFFPELNDLVIEGYTEQYNGKQFKEVAYEFINSGNINKLDDLINHVMRNQVLEKLFLEYLSNLDFINMTSKLKEWGKLSSDSKDSELKAEDYEEARELLEEFFWNSTFAASQIIQLTTSDLAFYKGAVDFQKRFKETYASGKRLNINSKYGKELETTLYITDQYVTSSRYNSVKASLERAVKEGRMTEEYKNWVIEQLQNINVADAQAFRSPYAFRSVLDMMGVWTDDMEESFDRMINGEWNMQDLSIIWQTIKPFVFTNVPTNDGLGSQMRVPHQNKNSEFVVLAFFDMIAADSRESDFLKGLGKFFDKHREIDVIQFESAVKTGGQGLINLNYNEDQVKAYLEDTPENALILKYIKDAAKEKKISKDDFNGLNNYDKLMLGLNYMLDHNKISQEDFNELTSDLENTDDEIVEILERKIGRPIIKEGKYAKDKKGHVLKEYNYDKGIYNHGVLHTLPYIDYMIAQPTPEHLIDVDRATAGSQYRNLVLANITDPDFHINIQGVELNKTQVFNLYRIAATENLLDGFDEVVSQYKDIHKLQAFLLNTMQGNPKYGKDIIDALNIITITDPYTGNKKEVFNLPLDLPTIYNQVQELLTSTFKNHVTKQKINGGACIQVAGVGLTRHLNILRDKDNNIEGAECMLPAWSKRFFRPFLVTKYTEDGKEYEELDINLIKETDPRLLRMIGYRIPTENKYSMLPLIVKGFLPQHNGSAIMLPAEITTLAGSDYDVDKMYLRIPSFELDEEGNPKKIDYDLKSIMQGGKINRTEFSKLNKKQRDNLMIDIEYAVLTSKEGSEQVFKPGNFDNLKKQSRMLRIMNDDALLYKVVKENTKEEEDKNFDTLVEENMRNSSFLLKMFNKLSLKDLEDVVSSGLQMNSLTPTTYKYFHAQNMTGSSLIGVYANGSSLHCKAQDTTLEITKGNEFYIIDYIERKTKDGIEREPHRVKFNSLHSIRNEYNEYIQDNIAEFQGASVDNAKELALADLNQTMYTANETLFMLRAGMTIQQVALLSNAVKNPIRNMKIFKANARKYMLEEKSGIEEFFADSEIETSREEMIDTFLFIKNNAEVWEALNASSEEIKQNPDILKPLLLFRSTAGGKEELDRLIRASYRVNKFHSHIKSLKTALKIPSSIMKADSPNNAIEITFAGALGQRRDVDLVELEVNKKSFPFRGADGISVNNSKQFIRNNVINITDSRGTMRDKLLDENLPILQSFYSLGIELAVDTLGEYLIQGDPLLGLGNETEIGKLRIVLNNSFRGNISDRELNNFYKDFMQFILTTTKFFGEDFNVKRAYYLTQFPAKALKLRKKNKELSNNPVVAALKIVPRNEGEAGNITLNLGQKTKTVKETIRRNLNLLLYSEDPEVVTFAKDLFMYSYYYDGFRFTPNSIGSYFDSTYWNNFPEVVTMLRTIRMDSNKLRQLYNIFLDQYLANHSDDSKDDIIRVYSSKVFSPQFEDDGSVLLRAGDCYNKFSNDEYNTYIRVKVKDNSYKLYKIDSSSISTYKKSKDADEARKNFEERKDMILRYIPMPLFDEYQPVYNAQSNAKQMEKFYFNDRKLKYEEKQKAEKEKKIKDVKLSSESDTPTASDLAQHTNPGSKEFSESGTNSAEDIVKDNIQEFSVSNEDVINSSVQQALISNDYNINSKPVEKELKSLNIQEKELEEELVRRLKEINPCNIK